MDAFLFKSFWPEFFLSFSILVLLLFNSKIINNLKFKFPILEHEIFVQSFIILFYVFLLLSNNVILSFDSNYFFFCDLTSNTAKFFLLGFNLLFFSSIWRSFLVQKLNFFEYFIIFLLAVLGLLFLISSFNLLSLYLCLELQAISFYVLASFQRNSIFSSEAGLKYFISSSLMSGIFILGCSCFFFSFGTFNLHFVSLINILSFYENYNISFHIITFGILCLFLVFFFKLVVAPFHFWFPQVYDGSPLSSLITFSTLPKIILFVLFLRFFSTVSVLVEISQTLLFLIGSYSIFFGIFKALKQKRLKKLYIYSSISQMGLPLCALADNSLEAFNVIFFYLFIYLLTSALMWSIFVILYENYSKTHASFYSKSSTFPLFISSLKHIFFQNPSIAFGFIFLFFSLAGIPPLAGFLSKIYIYIILIQSAKYEIASFIFYISAFGVYYYIKVLKIMFYENINLKSHFKVQSSFDSINLDLDYTLISLIMFLLFFFGLFPNILYIISAPLTFYSV